MKARLMLIEAVLFVVSLFLLNVDAEHIDVLKPLQNVLALQNTAVSLSTSIVNKEDMYCDISIENIIIFENGKLYGSHDDELGNKKILQYRDAIGGALVSTDETKRYCDITIPSMMPYHAGLYSFSFQDGSESYGAYIAYLESGPTCSSNRDSGDKHQSGDSTILTCTLLASGSIQRGLELVWHYRDGTPLDKSLKIGCDGVCNSVAGDKNYILTSQVKLVAKDHGIESITCSVRFNATLLVGSDIHIAKNADIHAINCSIRSYPLVIVEKVVSRNVVNDVDNDSIAGKLDQIKKIIVEKFEENFSFTSKIVLPLVVVVIAKWLFQIKKVRMLIWKICSCLYTKCRAKNATQERSPVVQETVAQETQESSDVQKLLETNEHQPMEENLPSGESVNLINRIPYPNSSV